MQPPTWKTKKTESSNVLRKRKCPRDGHCMNLANLRPCLAQGFSPPRSQPPGRVNTLCPGSWPPTSLRWELMCPIRTKGGALCAVSPLRPKPVRKHVRATGVLGARQLLVVSGLFLQGTVFLPEPPAAGQVLRTAWGRPASQPRPAAREQGGHCTEPDFKPGRRMPKENLQNS